MDHTKMNNSMVIKCECESCAGTGVFVGYGEKDGAAVICKTCKGTGKDEIRLAYNDFTGRKIRKGIKRVYEANPGVSISESIVESIHLEDFGCLPYDEWLEDKPFPVKSEMRNSVCPSWWYRSRDSRKD